MYTAALRNAAHVRRLIIRQSPSSGWEVLVERDATVTRAVYHDWHRVERVLAIFKREEVVLQSDGWIRTRE